MAHDYEYAVFIGRFQPFHNGHLEIAKAALKKAESLIVVIGSARSGRTVKNPFTFEERANMVRAALGSDASRVVCIPLRDQFYNDQLWLSELHQKVRSVSGGSDSIALVGQYSDESSYYLNMFPQWDFVPVHTENRYHATEIRSSYFGYSGIYSTYVPKEVGLFMSDFSTTQSFLDLVEEYEFTEEYRSKWSSAPFVPFFVTADAVAVQAGHVLLVKRKFNPGRGKWALPGGFVKPNETIVNGAIRELYEETKLLVPKERTRAAIVGDPKVFDYPSRSLRGRTITHAVCVHFKDDYRLPDCKGSDDAEKAQWVPIGDLARMEEDFFEDHLSIIEYWLHRIK